MEGDREQPAAGMATFPPRTLRQYALLADGERGAILGPSGEVAFLCAPRWHDDAVFAGLLGGPGTYAITPHGRRHVWGGHYDQDTLVWRSHWVAGRAVIEAREALAFPGDPDRLVLLRTVEAPVGTAHVDVVLEVRAGFGERPMTVRRTRDGVWEGRSGDLAYRWSGAPPHTRLVDGRLVCDLVVPHGGAHDLVLEIGRGPLPTELPDASALWRRTTRAWADAVPDLSASAAPGESHHSYAILRGLTSSSGAMVAAATTALPERAEEERDYDYRYAWIRDQCYTGQAAAAIGDDALLDASVRFVSARVLADGPQLRPAYTVDGGAVPDPRRLPLPGYPGAEVSIGNRIDRQFQLDAFGEALLLLTAADRAGRLDDDGRRAVETLAVAIEKRHTEPDAGIWELDDRRWAHSRLMCAAGLRAAAARRTGADADAWSALADHLVDSVTRDCLHPDGRWQRSPDDPGVDAALLLPGIRGAVACDDPRHLKTVDAVIDDLADDGYVYRFRHDPDRPLHAAEGAFVLSGFHLALAEVGLGRREAAVRHFERNRSAVGPPGIFAEEYDVVQRQLRGNLPQAFVHALLLETARRLHDAGVDNRGFTSREN